MHARCMSILCRCLRRSTTLFEYMWNPFFQSAHRLPNLCSLNCEHDQRKDESKELHDHQRRELSNSHNDISRLVHHSGSNLRALRSPPTVVARGLRSETLLPSRLQILQNSCETRYDRIKRTFWQVETWLSSNRSASKKQQRMV